MRDRFFLDTNIFVYSFDALASAKQKKAQTLIETGLQTHQAVISTQVVQEFLNVATMKFTQPLSGHDAVHFLDTVLTPLCDVFPSLGLFRLALGLQSETHYSFYDCMILSAALEAGCGVVYTEDLQHTQRVRGLTIVNPFVSPSR